MTIIIPTWLVVSILCLFVVRTIVFIKRGAAVIKGVKAVWPIIKEYLGSEKNPTIEISKKLMRNENTGLR